jgi:uncharacterized cupin superfamily protein
MVAAGTVHEMITVVSGAVIPADKDGRSESFGSSDTSYMAKGQRVAREITEKLSKIYMIVT